MPDSENADKNFIPAFYNLVRTVALIAAQWLVLENKIVPTFFATILICYAIQHSAERTFQDEVVSF